MYGPALDSKEFAVKLVEKGHLELDAVGEVHDAVRARHQAKGRQSQNAQQRHDIHRRRSHGQLYDNHDEQSTDDKRLDDHARQL